MESSRGSGYMGGNDDDDVLPRYSLDVSAGCGARRSTLLDEYERLAFEAQLNSVILRRCYSEPSPARFVQPEADTPPPEASHGTPELGEGRREEPAATAAGRWSWRLHGMVARWLQMLKPAFRWLGGAWERRRKEQPRGPPTMPARVQLVDYFC
ncbi:hypothetical protein BRADI_2g22260v3 [Brachypodium distachyon]|uniref:Uncharacterized protein n=1 Tax=Brachypodium distachyon TaxID=15368 RepID=I1HIF0_BRADI|nr:hypothetical protein BRADI_2g22260v3 [Brachypodium distachyon]